MLEDCRVDLQVIEKDGIQMLRTSPGALLVGVKDAVMKFCEHALD
jgi:hypothetical protein